jgi:hypothetical protein
MSDPAVDQLHQGGAYDYSHPGRLDNNGGVRDGAPYHHHQNINNNNPWNDDTTPLMNNDGVVAHTNNSNHPTPINRGKQAGNRASGPRGVMVGGGGGKLPKDLNMHKLFGAVKQTINGGGGGNNNNNNTHGGGAYGASTLSPTTSTSPRTVVLPPESAIRTRCYRLNLNTDIIIPTPTTANTGGGIMSSSTASPVQGSTSGPYRCDSHAALGDRTVDLSSAYVGFCPSLDDSIADDHRDTVASTARIFRGLTVNHDGSIVSHHHRSSKGSTGPKRDEKSRQSTKIDQAVDMAEEAVRKGTTTTTVCPCFLLQEIDLFYPSFYSCFSHCILFFCFLYFFVCATLWTTETNKYTFIWFER